MFSGVESHQPSTKAVILTNVHPGLAHPGDCANTIATGVNWCGYNDVTQPICVDAEADVISENSRVLQSLANVGINRAFVGDYFGFGVLASIYGSWTIFMVMKEHINTTTVRLADFKRREWSALAKWNKLSQALDTKVMLSSMIYSRREKNKKILPHFCCHIHSCTAY